MNFKTTYILFGLLAVILAVLGVTLYMGPSTTTESKFLLPSLRDKEQNLKAGELERVERVEIERTAPTKETLIFVREGTMNRWKVNGFRADAGKVTALLQQLFEADKTKADEPPKNLADWGLNPPEAVITIGRGDQPKLTIDIGKVSTGEVTGVIYARSSDRPKDPIAVPKAKLDSVLKSVKAFRERELLAPNTNDLLSITLAEGTSPKIVLEKGVDGWKFLEPFKGASESEGDVRDTPGKPPTSSRALLESLTNFKVEVDKTDDFVADAVPNGKLSEYGLGPTDEVLRVTVKRSEENLRNAVVTVLIGVGKKIIDEKKPDEKKPDEKIEKYNACIEGENNIVRIPAKSVDAVRALLKNPDAMRDKRLVRATGAKSPDAVLVRNANSEKMEFFKSDSGAPPPFNPHMPPAGSFSEWKMYRGSDAITIDQGSLTKLIGTMTQPNSVESFKVTEADFGVTNPDKAEAVVEVWIDGIEPEKKDPDKKDEKKAKPKLKDPSKPSVKLIFGRRRPDKMVAVKREVPGEDPVLLLVKDVILEAVNARPLDYMSKELPSYVEKFGDLLKGVSRLELTREGKEWVVTREGGKDDKPWKIEKPETLKGRDADKDAIIRVFTTLIDLKAVSIDAESASDDALVNIYKLKPPDVKAAIAVVSKVGDKEETKTYEYAFAKPREEKDKGKLRYGKQSQRAVVFSVPDGKLDGLNQELLDPTVFSFDPTKVKTVTLKGWYALEKETKTLELEKSATGNWVVKGTGKPAASGNVDRLLSAMANLKAQRFAAHGVVGKPDPSYEFDDKNALVITLTVEGKEGKVEPIELTLGKLDADTNYFAVSPQLKGDVFLVNKEWFKDARSAPGYFKE